MWPRSPCLADHSAHWANTHRPTNAIRMMFDGHLGDDDPAREPHFTGIAELGALEQPDGEHPTHEHDDPDGGERRADERLAAGSVDGAGG